MQSKMSSPYQKALSGNQEPMNLEHINRDFNPNQQVAVYVLPEERGTQSGFFQGKEVEGVHLGRKWRGLAALLIFQFA
jgi:hypothetical protein